jgi:ABC-2 type transport system permease protein
MTKALLVALLQIRIYLRDRADLAFSILLPIAVFALGYGAFGGETQFNGTAHVVNLDRDGIYSNMLLENLERVDGLAVDMLTEEKAETKLDRADILMAVYIPRDFADNLESGERTELIINQRGNGGDEGQIVVSIISGIAGQMAQEFQVKKLAKHVVAGRGGDVSSGGIDIKVQQLLEDERDSPTVAVQEEITGGGTEIVHDLLPGILTMFVLFATAMSARALVEERKKGTLERLLTTRLSLSQLFVGKFLVNVSRGYIQTLILLLLAYAVFQIFTPISFLETLVLSIVFVAAVSGLGVLIGSAARTEDQATWIAVFFTMLMVMLGGTFFEIPESGALNALSKISLNTYAIDGYKTLIAEGGSLGDTTFNIGVMAGVAAVGLLVSRLVFKVIPGGR